MKQFLKKTFLFLLPFFVIMGIPAVILFQSKENFFNIDKVIKDNNPFLVGYMYNEDNYKYLKWKTISLSDRYEIWALGSSRVLQFKKEMFDSTFYNAGYTIASINDLLPFLKSIQKEKYPKYLILGLDQWMFNEKRFDKESKPVPEKWSNSFKKNPDIMIIKNVWKDMIDKKYLKTASTYELKTKKIGLNAVIKNTGFINDGSFLYGIQIEKLMSEDSTASDYLFNQTKERIEKGKSRFVKGKNISSSALYELDKFLQYCKDSGITVIGILPPFADDVNKTFRHFGNHAYIEKIYPNADKVFQKYNFEFYDMNGLDSELNKNNEFIDGFHGGELIYQKVLINMLESKSILNDVTSKNRLEKNLENSKNRYTVY